MTTSGLRERKKLETRRALRAAAIELSLRDGPDAITIEQICDHAGIGRRTFFNYFPSKDDAVVGWTDDHLEQVSAAITGRPDTDDDAHAAAHVAVSILEAYAQDFAWRAQLELARAHPEIAPRMLVALHRLEDAIAIGLGRRPGEARATKQRLLAAVTATVLRVAVSEWLTDPSGPTPAEHFRALFARLGGSDIAPTTRP